MGGPAAKSTDSVLVNMELNLEKTGFCWKCGGLIQIKAFRANYNSDLFCSKKHEEQYSREQDRQIKKGKKAGYGLAGSTH